METIKINGKKYEISFVDTEETVKNMVALKENTFDNYVKVTEFDPNAKKIKIELLPNDLKNVKESDLVNKVNELHKGWQVPKTDIALEWLQINNDGKLTDFDIELANTLKKIDETEFWGINAINTSSERYKKRKATALKELKQLVEKERKFAEEYDKYTPVDTTKFLQDSVIIDYTITISLDPLEAFDSINLNSMIPYARLKTGDQIYYKLLKNLVPQKNWLEGDSTFVFKIRSDDKEGWGTATLVYTGITEPFEAVLTIESAVGSTKSKTKTTEELIKNTIIGLFTGAEIKIINRKEKGIKGVFAVPEISISRDVFLDLITNEPMVSHYLYVDETRELSSQKGVLYLYYSTGDNEAQVLTVFLSERIASRSDIFYTSGELLLFTPYLNVRVSRAMTLDQVNRFKKVFATILDIYKQKFTSIVKAYDAVIPGFKSTHELAVKKAVKADKRLKELQSLDSELFIHGYPTSCEKKRQPIPIDSKQVNKYKKEGRQVMNYPKDTDNYFVCSGENEYKYPGLMKNKLNNSDQYPYLPCCYPKNQQVGTKLLNLYLKDLSKVAGSKTTNIVTKKIVGRTKLGQLPRNIHHILMKTANPGEEYFRQGTAVGNNSFIETILLALDPNYEKMSDSEKTDYVQDFRNNLASVKYSAIIQELYDVDSEKITKDILDPEVPFDSKVFVGLLEAYYNCQIVVFERTENQENGEFEIPRYTQGYLYKKLDPNKVTVLVYKHMGIRSDSLEDPHYELIIKKYKKITTWYFNGQIVQNIYSYFLQSYKLHVIGIGRYAAITVPPAALADATGQVIDRYGKTRGYTFDNDIYVTISPITPAYDLDMVDPPTERPSLKNVQQFITNRNLQIISQDISDGMAIGFAINFPSIPYAYIPFQPTKKLAGYPEAKHLGFSVATKEDILQTTVNNKKIADYLMQLILYRFSLWYADKMTETDVKNEQAEIDKLGIALQQVREKSLLLRLVDEYLDEEIVIIPDHEYDLENLPRRLTLNSSFFEDDRLIVDSEETFNRLSYYLRFMLNKNKALVLRYSERIYLENYYTYAADFKERKGQLIFVGGLAISNWIETQQHGVSNQVHTVPHANLDEPFFFAHWAINTGKPVLFQNVRGGSLGRALAVSANYLNKGINTGYNTLPVKEIAHSYYFLEDGVLKKDGTSPVVLWKFADNYYAAILIP